MGQPIAGSNPALSATYFEPFRRAIVTDVHLLYHVHLLDDEDDSKLIGVYSTRETAADEDHRDEGSVTVIDP